MSTHIFRYQKVHAPTDVHKHRCKETELDIDSDRYSTRNYDRNRCIQTQNSRALSPGCFVFPLADPSFGGIVPACGYKYQPPPPPSPFLPYILLSYMVMEYIYIPSLPPF